MKEYYDTRAPEYDDWYLGHGRFADRDRPGWDEELAELGRDDRVAAAQAHARRRVRHRLPHAASARRHHRPRPERADARRSRRSARRTRRFVQGDALELPFEDGELRPAVHRPLLRPSRGATSACASSPKPAASRRARRRRRVTRSTRPSPRTSQERILNDGSRWTVYKRFFEPDELAAELGGGETLFAGNWFVVVRA